jgi:hypothetical protein
MNKAVKNYYTLITLPSHLRGYVKYVVVLLPLDGRTYSLGIKYICQSEGAHDLLQRLDEQRNRKHKKPLHAFLCSSAATGTLCPLGWSCPEIHVTPEGFREKRFWDRPVKATRTLKVQIPKAIQVEGARSIAGSHVLPTKRGSLGSPSSDQGTEEESSDEEGVSAFREDVQERTCFDVVVEETAPTGMATKSGAVALHEFIPMSQAQIDSGHVAHNPYCMPIEAHAPCTLPAHSPPAQRSGQLTAGDSGLSSLSWADQVDDKSEMDFTVPLV